MLREPPHMRTPKENYNTDSGFRWGPFNLIGDRPWCLQIQQRGGAVRYPYPSTTQAKISQHVSNCDQTQPIIHKGNHFARFTHAEDYAPNCAWYYWDNSLLPQFMTPGTHNPTGGKVWARLTYRSPFPGQYLGDEQRLARREREVNDLLHEDTQGQCRDWREVCEWRPIQGQRDHVLLCLSSDMVLRHWYRCDANQVIEAVTRRFRKINWRVTVRSKPGRNLRNLGDSIDTAIDQVRPSLVIGVHSAVGMEAIARGCAYSSLGAHGIDTLNSDWRLDPEQWQQPTEEQFLQRARQLLLTTRHKQLELITGTWSNDTDAEQFKPYESWRIPL